MTDLLAGYTSVPVDVKKLLSILHFEQARGTTYGLGCKPKDLAASPAVYIDRDGHYTDEVDCSGFHRYLMYHAASVALGAPFVVLPDGSTAQNDFYSVRGFKHHSIPGPMDYTAGLSKSVLYACFCRAGSRGEVIGHVWFAYFDQHSGAWVTIESHGGHGPNSRSATSSILTHIVTDVYAICEI